MHELFPVYEVGVDAGLQPVEEIIGRPQLPLLFIGNGYHGRHGLNLRDASGLSKVRLQRETLILQPLMDADFREFAGGRAQEAEGANALTDSR